MTHQEAVERMKELSGGRAWSFSYEVISFYHDKPQIHGYIDTGTERIPCRMSHAEPATTYQQAIENVEIMLGVRKRIVDAAPEADV